MSSWGTTPSRARIFGPSVAGSRPSTASSPPLSGDTHAIMRIVEVLPAPFGPRNPKASPASTRTSMPSTATKSPNRLVSPVPRSVVRRLPDRHMPSTLPRSPPTDARVRPDSRSYATGIGTNGGGVDPARRRVRGHGEADVRGVGGREPEEGAELRHRLLHVSRAEPVRAAARALTIDVHDVEAAQAPPPMPTPEDEELARGDRLGLDRRVRPARAVRAGAGRRWGTGSPATSSLESVYDDYGTTEMAGPRDWPDGERSPGVLTVALIHRPDGLELRRVDRALARHAVAAVRRSCSRGPATCATRWCARSPTTRPRCTASSRRRGRPTEVVADPMLFFNSGGDPDVMQAQRREDARAA